MTPADAKALWAKVEANSAAFESCDGPHTFADLTPEKTIGKRWRCSLCGGECDSIAKHHYEQGLRHGMAVGATPEREAARCLCDCEGDEDNPGPHLPECPWADQNYDPESGEEAKK